MKCFKFLLTVLIMLPATTYAMDAVIPYDQKVINNGNIYYVQISSDKTSQELQRFVGQEINDVMYVISFRQAGEKKLFEVFVLDPPQKKQDEEVAPPKFAVKDIVYKYVKRNTQGEIQSVPVEFDFKDKINNLTVYTYLAIAFFCIIVFLLIFLGRIRRWLEIKKIKKQKAKELISKINNTKDRADYENLLEEKRYFKDLFHSEESLDELLEYIFEIQFKKSWEEKDWAELRKKHSQLQNLRRRDGV